MAAAIALITTGAVRASASSAHQATPARATFELDGVRVSVRAPGGLPARGFQVAPMRDASQVATSARWHPFREMTLTAVPFGTTPGTESLPKSQPGGTTSYAAALRNDRERQGLRPSPAPRILLFGSPAQGDVVVAPVHVDGGLRSLLIVEWVVAAGPRMWILRRASELAPAARTSVGARALAGLIRSLADLSVDASNLDAPSSLLGQTPPTVAGIDGPAEPGSPRDLPTPSWWNGDCDAVTYKNGSGLNSYRLGAVWNGLVACGPGPNMGGVDVLVRFFSGAWGEYEWECVELSMRYLYLAYAIAPYGANGSQVVWNYTGTRLKKIYNGTPGVAPKVGDVLSYGPTTTNGHTSVVTASSVNGSGNGTITVIEENATTTGSETLTVTNWTVQSSVAVTGWLHDGSGASSPWRQLSPASVPSKRANSVMAWDPATNTDIMFGGYGGGSVRYNDTWSWNGSNWVQLHPATTPSKRSGASMVYDLAIGKLLLFGGYAGGSYLNDTWTFDGTNWAKLSPTSSPGVRRDQAMFVETTTNRAIVFGGWNGTTYLNDTWSFNGTTWTQLRPSSSPSARTDANAAWDSTTGSGILFGGVSGTTYFGDTWTWNGTTWTKQSGTMPSSRSNIGIAYDSSHSNVVVLGGTNGSTTYADTWLWTGSWALQSVAVSPAARQDTQMAPYPPNKTVIMFGGSVSGVELSDTWQWS